MPGARKAEVTGAGGVRDAILYCGAAAIVWNPNFVDVAREKGLAILAVEEASARYANAPSLSGLPFVWAEPGAVAAIMAAIAEHSTRLRIRGVCALREDWVETAALLADWLGLPTIGLRAAQVCQDKALQRMYLERWSPRSSTALDRWTTFPAVVKPIRGSAGVGVRPVRGAGELDGCGDVLIEELIGGPEFSVETLVQGGTVVFAGVTAKRTNETTRDAFVELAHTVPALLPEEHRRILREANDAVVRRLAVGDGILHAEYRLDPSGRAVLMEVNARCPGGSIPALYHLATGARLEQAIVDIAVGDAVDYPAPFRTARQVYVTHRPGVLREVSYPGMRPTWLAAGDPRPAITPGVAADPPRLHAVLVIKPRGSALGELDDNRDRAVTFIIDAPGWAELDAYERTVDATLRVEV